MQAKKSSKFFKYYMIAAGVVMYLQFIAYIVYVSIYVANFDAWYFLSYFKANATFAYWCCKFQFLIFSLGIRFYLLNMAFE